MRPVGMTPGNDNKIVWLLRITDGTNTYRLATQDITLDDIWDGKALGINSSRFSFNEFGKRINIIGDGTLGEVATVTFSFSRFVGNTLLDAFFNEFHPATSGKILVSANVELGMVWETATDDDDITWLQKYNVEDYSYDDAQISLLCSEFSEFENSSLPYYKIQKDYDNGMSYFPNAAKENYGSPIPFVYGEFKTVEQVKLEFALAPALEVDEANLNYIICSHKAHSTSYEYQTAGQYSLFKYINGLENYMTLYKTGTSAVNTEFRHSIKLQETVGILYGAIKVPFRGNSSYNEVSDIRNVTDGDETTYVEIDGQKRLALRIGKETSTSEFGYAPAKEAGVGVGIIFRGSSDSANTRSYTVNYRNNTLPTAADGGGATATVIDTTIGSLRYGIGDKLTAKQDSALPWSIEELLTLEYFVSNNDATSTNRIRVYAGYLNFIGVIVMQVSLRKSEKRIIRSLSPGRAIFVPFKFPRIKVYMQRDFK